MKNFFQHTRGQWITLSLQTFAVVIIICVLCISLYAGTTGKITGFVKDRNTGEALIGVNVRLEGTTLGAATDIDGRYNILNIPPGEYSVVASLVGYSQTKITGVQVKIDLTTTIDIELSESVVVGQEVIVVAERPLVQKDLTAKTAIVSGKEIADLPVTEVGAVLSLQAGFVAGSLRGGRGGEVAYWIDGVPLTDGFNGSQVVEVNKSLVQELQLVSGAFNAEYGQAMSGIVNIATKEGGTNLVGGIGVYGGDYLTSEEDLFPGLSFSPTNIRNIEGNLSGPLLGEDVTFFANGRYIYFDGYLKGFRRFNPWNIAYTDSAGTYHLSRDIGGKGDSTAVSMNWSKRSYGQAKLTWRLASTVKLTGNYIYDYNVSKAYNRSYFFNPDGIGNNYNTSHTMIFQFTHTLNQNTFYTIGGSYFSKEFKYYLYDLQYDANGIEIVNPGAQRYTHPKLFVTNDSYSYLTGGSDLSRFKRSTDTKLLKFDVTSQIDASNLVKAGMEVRSNDVAFESIQLQPIQSQSDVNLASGSPFIQTQIRDVSSNFHDYYRHKPSEFSAYIQDKMEFKNIIVNLGIRFDYFQPDGVVLNDDLNDGGRLYTVDDPSIYNPIKPTNRFHDLNGNGTQDAGESNKSVDERRAYYYRKATAKSSISPRLGVSFPITDRGVVHFSYGHFFQVPRFERLYENPDFKIGLGTGNQGVIGNADLAPEQTISGEIGVQQQLTDDISLDLTAYLRDIRNLTGTRGEEIIVFGGSSKYSKYINSDFGFVKGVVLTVDKRFSSGLSASLDYTYQVARGSASDPQEARNAVAGGALPEVQLTPLGWDQRHTLNVTANYTEDVWGLSLIAQYGSGTPYTPRSSTDISAILTNSQLKPSFFNVDARAFYTVNLDAVRLVLFARVFNVLDIRNETNVFNDTGRAGFTTDEEVARATRPREYVNSLDQWFRITTNYSEPRRFEMGMNLEF
ncbi:MAG TPA: TonB-dependent receptor [Bacteroidota bacterium]|nr:TonB-dependent receptor [Bacteroidota bacterium]